MADRTHLHRAAQRGDIGAVRALVQAVDVNVRGGWRVESPLHAASRAGNPDVIACLMSAGAHTEIRDRNNDTPLLLAAWLGHAAAVSKLLAAGARVDADGIPRSALHCACMQGHANCVSELLRGGADESVEDEDGNTPLQVVGTMSESMERAENIVLIHAMLRRAPADRSWRRRGWLVILRARECAAANRILPLSPPAVTTRGAARRAEFDATRPLVGPWVSPQEKAMVGQSKGVGGTRLGRERLVFALVERKVPKRPLSRGGGGVRGAKLSPRKRPGKLKPREEAAATSIENDRNCTSRLVMESLVARLIDLGEEGAFRCVIRFL